jgi:hypothetical protein
MSFSTRDLCRSLNEMGWQVCQSSGGSRSLRTLRGGGLLRMGKPVTIVGDAVCALSEPAAQNFLERFIRASPVIRDSAEIRDPSSGICRFAFQLQHEDRY